MVNSLPASDVLKDSEKLFALAENSPVVLSENGKNKFVLLSIEQYNAMQNNYLDDIIIEEDETELPDYIKTKLQKSLELANTTTERLSGEEVLRRAREAIAKYENL